MSKPILYLDIDGVLNVFAYGGQDYDDCLIKIGTNEGSHAFDCVVPPYIAKNVKRLQDHYDIVWCTAWRGSAHYSWRRILDLPATSWEYIDYKDMKLPELLKHAKDHRWAYVDDEAAWEVAVLLGKYKRKLSGGYYDKPIEDDDFIWPNGKCFPVHAARGLDDDLTERLIEYASNQG